MAEKLKHLWVEKYRPTALSDYIFQDEAQSKFFHAMIMERNIPHLLLSGTAGTGKTTLSKIIVKELDLDPSDVLLINASDENSVDVMREKIKIFITTLGVGYFKIVQLEEADYITPNGQAVLRQMMEEYSGFARFILTANYDHKIIPAIKSRCQNFRFKAFDKDDIAERVAEILIAEQVKADIDLVDKFVAIAYPDIRKIINLLQQNTIDGVLTAPATEEVGEYKFKLLELLAEDKWFDIRKLVCENVASGEWEEVYRFLYDNLDKSGKFSIEAKWEAGIVVIADYLYRHSLVADSEINATAMFISLSQL